MVVVEEWKCIRNYENYEISSMGRVRRSNKILKFDIANMYYRVDLYKNGSRIHKYVHRLVLEHYKINPNLSKFTLCDHINRNTFDNRISNLRWSNYQENSYNRQAKGYYYCRRENKFIATIQVNGKSIYLGKFNYSLLARKAYIAAKAKYHVFSC